MKLSRQEEIALLFTSELANHRDVFVSLSDVADKHALSLLFLKKIAGMLKKNGLIISKEGQGGGYKLLKLPEEISAWDVITAVGGNNPTAQEINVGFQCPLRPSCMPQKVRLLLVKAFQQYAADVTIDQFIKRPYTPYEKNIP